MPFQPGNKLSKGRPKGADAKAAEEYRKLLVEKVKKAKGPILDALIRKAQEGDMSAIREIHERLMGKVKENVDLNGTVNHSFNDLPEDLYTAILERERSRIKISGAE